MELLNYHEGQPGYIESFYISLDWNIGLSLSVKIIVFGIGIGS